MTEQDGIGFEIDCLILLDWDDDEVINELWAEATINTLNLQNGTE